MAENDGNNSKEPHRPRYLPPVKSGQKKSKNTYKSSNQLPPPKLLEQREPRESLLSFSTKGRLGRLSFQAAELAAIFVVTILATVLFLIGMLVIPGLADKMQVASSHPFGAGFAIVLLILVIFVFVSYFIITLSIRRLHDVNLSGWWVLISIVPGMVSGVLSWIIGSHIFSIIAQVISDLFLVFLILAPSTKGENRFGAPRSTSFWEKVFGVISIIGLVWIFTGEWMLIDKQYNHYFSAAQHPTDTTLVTSSNIDATPKSGKYHAPYPFTAQQLWVNLLKVTALPDGTLSKAQIEDALGTTLQPDNNAGALKDPYFATKAGVDWYFSTNLDANLMGLNKEYFLFGWSDPLMSDPPKGMCINALDVKPSLVVQGWIQKSNDSEDIPFAAMSKYFKGKDYAETLEVVFDPSSKCITSVRLMAPSKLTPRS